MGLALILLVQPFFILRKHGIVQNYLRTDGIDFEKENVMNLKRNDPTPSEDSGGANDDDDGEEEEINGDDEHLENDSNGRKSQVISITHSQSIAAAADIHIVIQKSISTNQNNGRAKVLVECVDGDSRRMELARMTSGDLANDEAQKLADALLRHASEHKSGNFTFNAMENITP